MVAALVALVVSLMVPLAPPTEGCPDVHIIGARGSGQPSGYGEQVAPVVEALVDALAAIRGGSDGVGEAVRRTRVELLASGNLMGLLLVAYGDADWMLS